MVVAPYVQYVVYKQEDNEKSNGNESIHKLKGTYIHNTALTIVNYL
jgi:hypothetical protein